MSDRANLELELFELLSANEKATSWGAAVGARSERIKDIESALRRMDSSTGAPAAPDHAFLIDRLEKWQADPKNGVNENGRTRRLFKEAAAALRAVPPVRSAASTVEPVALDMVRRLVHEFEPGHYHNCPADHKDADPNSCVCFGGHLIRRAKSILAAPTTSPEPDAVREKLISALRYSTDMMADLFPGYIPGSGTYLKEEKRRDEQIAENRDLLDALARHDRGSPAA